MKNETALVYVVDDDESVRESLESLIRSAGLRVISFASPRDFLVSPLEDVNSCLVLDLRLPGESGLDLQKRLAELHIQTPIVFITAHGDIPTSVRAMKAGAIEFLTKPFRDEDLLNAIEQALEHDRSIRSNRANIAEVVRRYESLTPREREVMALVVSGLLNKQVAVKLGITEVTIKVHRAQVMQKMRAESIQELVRMFETLKKSSTTSF